MIERHRETEGWHFLADGDPSGWDIAALEEQYGLSWLAKRFFRIFPRWAPWCFKIRHQWSPREIQAMEKRDRKPLEINMIGINSGPSQEKIDAWKAMRAKNR